MVRILSEWGKRRKGFYTPIARNPEEAMQVTVEPGIVYEHRIKTRWLPDWIIEPVTRGVLGLQETFQGLEVLYYKVERGEVTYQFWYPPQRQVTAAHPALWAIIGLVLGIIFLFVLGWVVFKVAETPIFWPLFIAVALGAGGYFLLQARKFKETTAGR